MARFARRLAVAWFLILIPVEAFAVRPLDTEDTGTLEPGRIELELSGDYADAARETVGAFTGVLAAGVWRRLELKFGSSYLFIAPNGGAAAEGMGDSAVRLKYRLVDETRVIPAVLSAWTVRLPTGDEPRGLGEHGVDLGVLMAVSKTFAPITLTWNGGYIFATADRRRDVWTLAGSLEYRLTDRWWAVGELVSALSAERRPHEAVARVGAMYAVSRRLRLDAAVATGLTPRSPDVLVTLGLTLVLR